MTNKPIKSKWMFIADWLRELNAPKKVINAAIAIDDALESRDLGYNTRSWVQDFDNVSKWDRTNFNALLNLIMNDNYCTACENCEWICFNCKLGEQKNCTPRHWYADEYFSIIKKWIEKKKALGK